MTCVPLLLVGALITGSQLADHDRAALSGVWVREGGAQIGLEHTEPTWQQIAVGVDTVTVVRAGHPEVLESYLPDGTERQANRVTGENRRCRVYWETATLVTECHDSRDGGPGGGAPPIYTRETRRLDAAGRMVVGLTWRSGLQDVTRTIVYRKQVLR